MPPGCNEQDARVRDLWARHEWLSGLEARVLLVGQAAEDVVEAAALMQLANGGHHLLCREGEIRHPTDGCWLARATRASQLV